LVPRAIYRTIELSDGWNGRIISNEIYFSEYLWFSDLPLPVQLLMYNPLDALDGAMVTIAMYTINIAHPGILLASSPNKQVDKTLGA
jgi:hypothetical protein